MRRQQGLQELSRRAETILSFLEHVAISRAEFVLSSLFPSCASVKNIRRIRTCDTTTADVGGRKSYFHDRKRGKDVCIWCLHLDDEIKQNYTM